jgi:hypothetical protein
MDGLGVISALFPEAFVQGAIQGKDIDIGLREEPRILFQIRQDQISYFCFIDIPFPRYYRYLEERRIQAKMGIQPTAGGSDEIRRNRSRYSEIMKTFNPCADFQDKERISRSEIGSSGACGIVRGFRGSRGPALEVMGESEVLTDDLGSYHVSVRSDDQGPVRLIGECNGNDTHND